MTELGRALPRRPASSATANMLSDSGAIEMPGQQRVVAQHHLQVDRQHDHRAAEGDLLQQLTAHARAEQLGGEELGVDEGRRGRAACGRAATRRSRPGRPPRRR